MIQPQKRIMLANIDYRNHTTNEGNELQEGLSAAGWCLVGAGFLDSNTDVSAILKHHQPEAVIVHDKRDWDKNNAGCFNPAVSFRELGVLASRDDIFKATVVKDAGSMIEYHRRFCEEVKANAVITYYHDDSILPLSPWLRNYRRVRTYHSVDTIETVSKIDLTLPRMKAVVSGAVSSVYPLRQQVIRNRDSIGCDVITHPGYSNKKSHTPEYLNRLSRYRVHIATASAYNFALRKIIESVAVGTTPVTNLPEYDYLPEIDGALVRLPANATTADVCAAVEYANAKWNLDERLYWAERAQGWYDWRRMGMRLSNLIAEARNV